MQIDGNNLMQGMHSTNTSPTGSKILSKDVKFQTELENAQKKFDATKNKKSFVMTDEDIAKRNSDIKDASVQLEAIFLKMLYNDMWKTVPKDELFGDDNTMDIYRDMYHEELTKDMAQKGGIGLADYIYQQLTQTK